MTGAVEIWRPVRGFGNQYLVSSLGRVWSHRAKRPLVPGRKSSGHYNVCLGRKHNVDVHVLVAVAFVGPRPTLKHEVRHLNDDGADNAAANLVWGTRGENNQDKKWNRLPRNAKLTGEQAAELKRRIGAGENRTALATEFGLCRSAVHAVATGRYHRDA